MEQQIDRRELRRFQVLLPAAVRIQNDGVHEIATETRNVSARGVFFYLDRNLEKGSKIEFILTFPPELTFTQSIRVRFKGTVVRVEDPTPEGRVGVAAAIEEYEFLTEAGEERSLGSAENQIQ